MPMDEILPESLWSSFNDPELMKEIHPTTIDKIKKLWYNIWRKINDYRINPFKR